MEISQKIEDIKELFNQYDDWEDRYRQIIKLGKDLAKLDEEFKTDKYRVKGCQSQVWLYPQLDGNKVIFQADSDALLVKGIVAILTKVYSGETPQSILDNKPEFLSEVGITDHLSMNRSNGLASMIKQIQLYALAYSAVVK
jgi:cysteine desulfuration protein SufE